MEIYDIEFPFQELERHLKNDFGYLGEVIIRYRDLEWLKVRLTARNISKVLSTFMATPEKKIDMWMDGCDDDEQEELTDQARVDAIDKEMDEGTYDRLKVWTWGRGTQGQLGNGKLADIVIPEINALLD